ncbi:monovalent cation/H+ antiporter complex subunit F [Agrococcus sp. Marseille-P2731]|uniref:monovalent cation/H+ antiporter complex subunit F n=1 Tax=Agrococcus sp. Marseille-P2731 TaxID=1841862 RepID=UPI00093014BA|nr:monovalent cation/H+ antiporter complex subunit F [Agrococcus sp. Marseille-P2731]
MDVILIIAGVMLVVAAALTLVRIVRGPGPADRVVATDVLITTVAGSLAVEAAINHQRYTLPVILVLSLLAFAGTVSMARFVAGRESVVGTGPDAKGPAPDATEGDAPAEGEAAGPLGDRSQEDAGQVPDVGREGKETP